MHIHKNLNNGQWSVGKPVTHCMAVMAGDITFPDMRNSKNKGFWACVNEGARRRVFARAKAKCTLGIVGSSVDVQDLSKIKQGTPGDKLFIKALDLTYPIKPEKWLDILRSNGFDLVRLRSNPKEGHTYFFVDGEPNKPLTFARFAIFTPDGRYYAVV